MAQVSAQQLADALTAMTTAANAVRATANALQPAPGQPVAQAAAAAPRERNPANPPVPFDGTASKYQTFRCALVVHAAGIATNASKITSALSFMNIGGSAQAWAHAYYVANIVDISAGTITWDEFLVALDAHFLDPREAEYARERLSKCSMGKRSARDFFLEFDELRAKANLTDAVFDQILVEHLEKNVHAALVLAVKTEYESARNGTIGTLTTLVAIGAITQAQKDAQVATLLQQISYDRFRDAALRLDPSVARFTAPTTRTWAPPFQRTQAAANPARAAPAAAPPPPPPAPAARDPNAMDVDRTNANRNCYNCGRLGHIARDCPDPPKPRRGRGGRGHFNTCQLVADGVMPAELHALALDMERSTETPEALTAAPTVPEKDFPKPL